MLLIRRGLAVEEGALLGVLPVEFLLEKFDDHVRLGACELAEKVK